MSRPRGLSSPAVVLSSGSSVLRPDPADLAPPRFRGPRLYGRPCLSRALQAGPKSFPALPSYLSNHAVVLTPAGPPGALSHRFPDAASLHPSARGSTPSSFPMVRFHGVHFRRGRVRFMLRSGVLLAPGSDLALRRPGHYPRGFHQASHLLLMRDLLRGRMGICHGRTNSDWIS